MSSGRQTKLSRRSTSYGVIIFNIGVFCCWVEKQWSDVLASDLVIIGVDARFEHHVNLVQGL